MTATLKGARGATGVTPILDFILIKRRIAEIREIAYTDVTDIVMGDFFELARETMWRFRKGRMKPSMPTTLDMARRLGVTVEELTGTQPRPASPPPRPTPRPSGPSTPPRPAGPKTGDMQ